MRLLPPLLRVGPGWAKAIVVGIAVSTILSGSIASLATLRESSAQYLSRFSPKFFLSDQGVRVDVFETGGVLVYVLGGSIGSLDPPGPGEALLGPEAAPPGLPLSYRRLDDVSPLPPDSVIVNEGDLPTGARRLATFRISEEGGIPIPSVLSFMEVNVERLILLISMFGPFSAVAAAIVGAAALRSELEAERVKIALLNSLGATPSEIRGNLMLKSLILGSTSFLLGTSVATLALFSSRSILSHLMPFMTITISVPSWLMPLTLFLGAVSGILSAMQVDWAGALRGLSGRVHMA